MTVTILIAIGTRPEAIKMAPVVRALRREEWVRLRILATAQHRQMLDQCLDFFDIGVDIDLDTMHPGQDIAELTSRMLSAVHAVLSEEQPDLVLAQGDTTTVMVTARGSLSALPRGDESQPGRAPC
jgi:UDP-N-acetylglucosamine 2-epimerase (non-hydrolysing)